MHFIRFLISRVFWINVLVALVVTLGLVYGVILYLDQYTLHGETVEVPDFEGFHKSELDDFISDKPLNYVVIDSVYDAEKPRGVVIDQNPRAMTLVKPGRKIYLTLNAEQPPLVQLPILQDLTLRQARSRLEMYGLRVDTTIWKPAECTKCVIGVLYQGEKVTPGLRIPKGEGVDLIIGMGTSDELIPIPAAYGLTQQELSDWLMLKGLTLGLVRFDETVITSEDSANARVFRQLPKYEADAYINLGRSVDVFLTADSTKIPEVELWEQDSIALENR